MRFAAPAEALCSLVAWKLGCLQDCKLGDSDDEKGKGMKDRMIEGFEKIVAWISKIDPQRLQNPSWRLQKSLLGASWSLLGASWSLLAASWEL